MLVVSRSHGVAPLERSVTTHPEELTQHGSRRERPPTLCLTPRSSCKGELAMISNGLRYLGAFLVLALIMPQTYAGDVATQVILLDASRGNGRIKRVNDVDNGPLVGAGSWI